MGTRRTFCADVKRPPSVNLRLPPDEQLFVEDIVACLSTDLLNDQYRDVVRPGDPPTRGHCYVATEAAYHLFGRARGYKPRFAGDSKSGTHWWLWHPVTGLVCDPTESQTDGRFDYPSGKGRGFVPPRNNPTGPSRSAQILIDRVVARRQARGDAT